MTNEKETKQRKLTVSASRLYVVCKQYHTARIEKYNSEISDIACIYCPKCQTSEEVTLQILT